MSEIESVYWQQLFEISVAGVLRICCWFWGIVFFLEIVTLTNSISSLVLDRSMNIVVIFFCCKLRLLYTLSGYFWFLLEIIRLLYSLSGLFLFFVGGKEVLLKGCLSKEFSIDGTKFVLQAALILQFIDFFNGEYLKEAFIC